MEPNTKVCPRPCGGMACAPMAMGGIPPESQFSFLADICLFHSDNAWYQLEAVETYDVNTHKCRNT
jgi:hypothetical protein